MENKSFEMVLAQLGDDIKALRLAAGMSQESLALAAEVDRTYVSQLERGVANPSLLILHRLSNVMGREIRIVFESNIDQ